MFFVAIRDTGLKKRFIKEKNYRKSSERVQPEVHYYGFWQESSVQSVRAAVLDPSHKNPRAEYKSCSLLKQCKETSMLPSKLYICMKGHPYATKWYHIFAQLELGHLCIPNWSLNLKRFLQTVCSTSWLLPEIIPSRTVMVSKFSRSMPKWTDLEVLF